MLLEPKLHHKLRCQILEFRSFVQGTGYRVQNLFEFQSEDLLKKIAM